MCVREHGYAAASSRMISTRAGVNSSLIYYYFDTVDSLLVEALRVRSESRLAAYQAAVPERPSLTSLVAALRDLYTDDVQSGYVRLVSELVAAGISRPELGAAVGELMQPWRDFARELIADALCGHPLAPLFDPDELGVTVVMFYLGANLVTVLWPDQVDVDRLLARAGEGAALIDSLRVVDDGVVGP